MISCSSLPSDPFSTCEWQHIWKRERTHFGNFRPIQVPFYWWLRRSVLGQGEPTLRKAVWPSSSNPVDQHYLVCSGKSLWLLWAEWNKCRRVVSLLHRSYIYPPLWDTCSEDLPLVAVPLVCGWVPLELLLPSYPCHAHTAMRAKVNLILREVTWSVCTQPTRKLHVSFSRWPCFSLASINKTSLSLLGISENIFSLFFSYQ